MKKFFLQILKFVLQKNEIPHSCKLEQMSQL